MKKQIYIPIRKQLTFVLVIMSFMAGSYSQKSATTLKEESNIKYLKSLAAVISNLENEYTGTYVKPIELEDARISDNNLRFDELILTPVYSAEEEKIEVEDWMLDEEHFRIHNSSELFENDKEEKLVVEDWMLDEDHFSKSGLDDALYEVAEEEKPAIEEWMLDESHFLSDKNSVEDENTIEDELKVENWMLDPDHWVSRAD